MENRLDKRQRRAYNFENKHHGFQERKGIEAAILRVRIAQWEGKVAEVGLDLKSAYQFVRRYKAMTIFIREIEQNLAALIKIMLSENVVSTIWDWTNNMRTMNRGETHHRPLSLSLINFYIYNLIEIVRKGGVPATVAITLFADDVVGYSSNRQEPQRFMDVCTE